MLTESIIAVALASVPPCWKDRHDPRKPQQQADIASAVVEVANNSRRPVDKAAKLLTLVRWESAGCIAVHSGAHKGAGRGLFQIEGQAHRYSGPFVGLDYSSTLNAAWVASHILDRSHQCGNTIADVLTGYAGRACGTDWPTLRQRVQTYGWISYVINRELLKRHGAQS